MKVKFTIDKDESKALRQVLEDMPTDLCDNIDCPEGCLEECIGCDACPILRLNKILEKAKRDMLDIIIEMEN